MNSVFKIAPVFYEAPSVACYAVFVEKGFYLTSQEGDLEDLGGTKEEGDW
jgi:hypothetical protein